MKPTREQVLQWARDAFHRYAPDFPDMFEAFAAIAYEAGRKDEREACADLCEDSVPTYTKDGERWLKGRNGKPDVRLKELAPNLEAAWEQEQLLKKDSAFNSIHEGHILAAAIRARREHG